MSASIRKKHSSGLAIILALNLNLRMDQQYFSRLEEFRFDETEGS